MPGTCHRLSNRLSHRYGLFIVMAFCFALTTACSVIETVGETVGVLPDSEPPPALPKTPLSEQPYELTLTINASADINPDLSARPSPVQVRVFLTENTLELKDKTFEEVFDFTDQAFEPAPVATITIRPGQTEVLVLQSFKNMDRLSIAAAFREPYQTIWQASKVLSPKSLTSATATLSALQVRIDPPQL